MKRVREFERINGRNEKGNRKEDFMKKRKRLITSTEIMKINCDIVSKNDNGGTIAIDEGSISNQKSCTQSHVFVTTIKLWAMVLVYQIHGHS